MPPNIRTSEDAEPSEHPGRPFRATLMQQVTITVPVALEHKVRLISAREDELPAVFWRDAADRAISMVASKNAEVLLELRFASKRRSRIESETTRASFRIPASTYDRIAEAASIVNYSASGLIRDAAQALADERMPDDQLERAEFETRQRFERRLRIFQGLAEPDDEHTGALTGATAIFGAINPDGE